MTNGIYSRLKVLDLANEFGVYCGRLLACFGAEVIKVEKPGGDALRQRGPFLDEDVNPEKSLFFAFHNTGKKSITLDIGSKPGRELLKKIARDCDVLIETFPPGYLGSLGLGFDQLQQLNPGIIMVSITPFGQTGPYREWKAPSEIIPYALGGPMYESGYPDREPLYLDGNICSNASCMYAMVGIMGALFGRTASSKGCQIDVSLMECAANWRNTALGLCQMPEHRDFEREGSQSAFVPGALYKCKNGYVYLLASARWRYMVVWMLEIGMEVGGYVDPKYEERGGFNPNLRAELEQVNRLVNELCSHYTKEEFCGECKRRGIAAGIVATPKEVANDEHFNARGFFEQIDHPAIGSFKYAGVPIKLNRSPMKLLGPAPLIGQHNKEIYKKIGLTEEEMAELSAQGVI